MPSMISTLPGQAALPILKKHLVLGAHGPKELFVFLLDG
jgi:L-lactate dehydrogenase complex protein LldG